jgi:hypothetical protein
MEGVPVVHAAIDRIARIIETLSPDIGDILKGKAAGVLMRIDVQNEAGKKKDELGLGLVGLFLCLLTMAYMLGSPDYASAFPRPVERALTNMRNESDKAIEHVRFKMADTLAVVGQIAGR